MFGKKATAQCCLYLAAQHPGVAARDVDMLLGVCHAAGKLLPAIDVLHFVQKKIAESVRNEISYSKLQKTLHAVNVSLAKDTIADYIRYAEDAYLLFHLQNYYANLIEKESYPKFYFSDNGILSLFLDRKESVQLENMVAVALARAYPDDVYYLKSAKTNIDIDFYVPSVCLAVQAAYSIEGEARAREVGNLKKLAKNSQEGTRFIIVTYEEEETIQEDGVTIDVMPLYKFLLELEHKNNSKAC